MTGTRPLETTEGTWTRIRRRVALLAVATAGLLALIGPASAHALALGDLSAQPAAPPDGTTQAGANSNFEINVGFDAEDVENLRIDPGNARHPGQALQPRAPAGGAGAIRDRP